MAIHKHQLDLSNALRDLRTLTETLEALDAVVVAKDDPNDRANRSQVADITRDLLYSTHLCEAVKVAVQDEYWSIRGRG